MVVLRAVDMPAFVAGYVNERLVAHKTRLEAITSTEEQLKQLNDSLTKDERELSELEMARMKHVQLVHEKYEPSSPLSTLHLPPHRMHRASLSHFSSFFRSFAVIPFLLFLPLLISPPSHTTSAPYMCCGVGVVRRGAQEFD